MKTRDALVYVGTMGVPEDSGLDAVKLADRSGVAIVHVKDGYVLVFTKTHLQQMLALAEERGLEKCMVFVKRSETDK